MSEQEINIAIAEACGWRQSERNIAHWHHVSEPYSHILTGDLPNYCNDLNAMHKAEKNLDQEQAQKYTDALSMMPQDKCWAGCTMWHFSSRQRAEAFLRTIGKWKEAAK